MDFWEIQMYTRCHWPHFHICQRKVMIMNIAQFAPDSKAVLVHVRPIIRCSLDFLSNLICSTSCAEDSRTENIILIRYWLQRYLMLKSQETNSSGNNFLIFIYTFSSNVPFSHLPKTSNAALVGSGGRIKYTRARNSARIQEFSQSSHSIQIYMRINFSHWIM